MARANQYQWQAPGNGRLFDSSLEEWEANLMSQRCIGVLNYIDENPLVEKETFEEEIAEYLQFHYGHDPNDSNKGHFFRSLEFVGFIRNIDNLLSLSIDGKNFLNSMLNKEFDEALKSYILQLLKTSYPNHATKDNELSLFPFRIMFKLMSENSPHKGLINKKMFFLDIPFITNEDDVVTVLYKLQNEKYLEYLDETPKRELKIAFNRFYEKWYTWVVASLREMNILIEIGNRKNSYITLNDSVKDFIQEIVDQMEYEDMFFESEKKFDEVKNRIRCKPRNPSVISNVLEESNYTCFFSENHKTFTSNNRPNYVEGHHIIPVALNDSFSEELDCEENVIALCPNCHKAMHFAKNEYKEELLSYILENNKEFSKFDLSLEDMKEIYFNKQISNQVED